MATKDGIVKKEDLPVSPYVRDPIGQIITQGAIQMEGGKGAFLSPHCPLMPSSQPLKRWVSLQAMRIPHNLQGAWYAFQRVQKRGKGTAWM